MYQAIEELISAIKEEVWYRDFKEARSAALNNEALMEEIHTMERLLEEKQSLSQYSPYISLDEINEKIKKQNKILQSFDEMVAYQNALHVLNRHLDDISKVVFGGISPELSIGRIGKIYARYSR
jgi:cell fate (sporulation/competence/biofilm development) regulator YlbF (YheA/YmcA/DUF963 family)